MASPERASVILRPYRTEDDPFIYNSWLRSTWRKGRGHEGVDKDTWHQQQIARITELLRTQPVAVACLAEDPTEIIGYRVPGIFSYIKGPYRAEFQWKE